MVTTGAKGSVVNQSQVCCALGQQSLEGRRVPVMPSGRFTCLTPMTRGRERAVLLLIDF